MTDAVARPRPDDAVVQDVGVNRSPIANLTDLKPIRGLKNFHSRADGSICDPHQLGKRFLADDDCIVIANTRYQHVHETCRLGSLAHQHRPSFMSSPLCLDP